jgi:hypothetical protein
LIFFTISVVIFTAVLRKVRNKIWGRGKNTRENSEEEDKKGIKKKESMERRVEIEIIPR